MFAFRRQKDRLLAAEAKYKTLVEQLPLVTYIDALTESATSLYASPQVESLLGYSVDEWLSDPEFFPKLLHPDDSIGFSRWSRTATRPVSSSSPNTG